MKTCRQLKTAARGNLIGNYRITMGAFVIVMLLGTVIEIPFSGLVNGAATPTTNYIIYYIAEFLIAILSGSDFSVSICLSPAKRNVMCQMYSAASKAAQTDIFLAIFWSLLFH